MSDYFTKLAAKTLNTTPMVRPILRSWFGSPTQLPVEKFGKESAMPVAYEPGAPPHEVIETSETVMETASRPDAHLISREPTPASPEPHANNAPVFSVSPEVSLNFPKSGSEVGEAFAGAGRPPHAITQTSGLNSTHGQAAAAAPPRSKPEPWSGPSGILAAEPGAAPVFEKKEKKLLPGSEPEGQRDALPVARRKAIPVAQVPLRGPMPPAEPIEPEHDGREKAPELNFPMTKRTVSGPVSGRHEETLPGIVHVSIGRIEIRAATAPERPRKERSAASSSSALENYLSRRGGGA